MDFRFLKMQLVARLRAHISNGEITERHLARVTGISQPHLHNVLKGARRLSTRMADQILARLQMDLSDLLAAESSHPPCLASGECADCRAVPLLEGYIGPGYPYPRAISPTTYPFRLADVERLESPVAVRLAPDPHRDVLFRESGIVLLDAAEKPRLDPREDAYFALDLYNTSTIGRVRRGDPGWWLWVEESGTWMPVSHSRRGCLDWIMGRVGLVIQNL